MPIILKKEDNFPENVKGLPENYNFEVGKTLRTIKRLDARKVGLQFPDGLLVYAPVLIDTIEKYTDAVCTILGDVVYGACCIDDGNIDCDLLVHYGHSCLIPINEMNVKVLYVFVDIKIDIDHLYNLILKNFTDNIGIIGTIQFNSSVNRLKRMINGNNNKISGTVPQIKPLSPGEVLGCTSPIIKNVKNVIYIGDGRFHLESAMIQNPSLNYYKYCPFTRKLTKEFYNYNLMVQQRNSQINKFYKSENIGIILGSLGRQGNRKIMENVANHLNELGNFKIYKIIVDEINENILDEYDFIDAFVQVSCPRLSIDWGICYKKPLLSPFEVFQKSIDQNNYMMDYYAAEDNKPWKNYVSGKYAK